MFAEIGVENLGLTELGRKWVQEMELYEYIRSRGYKGKPPVILTFNNEPICSCACHQIGSVIIHCEPCCKHTYIKYIRDDVTLDADLYSVL